MTATTQPLAPAPTPRAALPVTRSILSASALREEIAANYAIDGLADCQLMRRGRNDSYLVTARHGRYIARAYRAHGRTEAEIRYELDLVRHLAERGLRASQPLPARDGRLVRCLPAPEGMRPLVLFDEPSGDPLSWDTAERCALGGRVAASIHGAADGFVSLQPRHRIDTDYLISAPVAALGPFLAHRPDDWAELGRLAERLRAAVAAAAESGLTWGVCHGDLVGGGIGVAEDGTASVSEFDLSGPGWRAFDLGVVRSATRWREDGSLWDAFLAGYTRTARPTDADVAAVPLFQAISQLWSMGFLATDAVQWGVLVVSDQKLDGLLASLRQWATSHPGGQR